MRSGNPVLSEKMLDRYGYGAATSSGTMTVQGTALKTGMLLVLVAAAAAFTWFRFEQIGPQAAMPWMMGGLIVGFVLAIITCFKVDWAPWTSPLYAVAEGLFL
ncbi:MAG: Bax inhibitor-1/YccA family protein, partial [Planctomycetaceae bacterium]|nr:Bax inhibitor-1/YccA family protein [Planctomycetaceae bacterium]